MNVNICILRKSLLKSIKNVNLVQKANIYNRLKIGNRDWVGWGKNGRATYADDLHFPFPAVRFKENSNELLALREKEKGDWRKLSIEEKKCLYRASFRQTIMERYTSQGEWKSTLGWVLFMISLGIWSCMGLKLLVFDPLPPTFSEERRRAQLRKIIDNKIGIYNGIASLWDYDKDDWKK